jgi:hypothetical protein
MISRFFTTLAKVYRQSATQPDEDEKIVYSQSETQEANIYGHLEPASAELAEGFALQRNRAFNFWCATTSDIKIGDKLVIDTVNYKVVGILDYTYGHNKHKECVLQSVKYD